MTGFLMQIPREVPHPDNNTPLDFSNPFDVLIYVVLPLILIVLYFTLRKRRRNDSDDSDQNEELE
ncbi:MAG: adenylosuccinate synthetase [Flavobacteriaceae bacterium]|nr:adenylosuccinate synthetase [Flavobacteriaceae bacterium]